MSHPSAPILDFWFGDTAAPRPEWFRADPDFDALVRSRFGALVERALAGALPDWDAAPAPALARILLLDQFTRNIFRGTPRAFCGDALALAAAQALVARGGDQALPPLQRWFAYLPFEHAEDAAAQAQSLQLFGALAAAHPPLADALHWAQKHAVVIERFGRYPHRNLVLGRVSTPAEIEFLRQPGSVF